MSARIYPEIAYFPTREAGNIALRSWQIGMLRSWRYWLLLALLTTATTAGIFVFLKVGMRPLRAGLRAIGLGGLSVPVIGGILGGTFGVVATIALQWGWRNPARRHLRRQLIQLGIPICVPCGYDLRGQTSTRCPECGAPFDPPTHPTQDDTIARTSI